MEKDEFSDTVDECMRLLDENLDILSDIEYSLDSDKEDIIKTDLTRNDLLNMADEVADSTRIKKAESDFVRRYFEKNLD